jgi:hypothetical protein
VTDVSVTLGGVSFRKRYALLWLSKYMIVGACPGIYLSTVDVSVRSNSPIRIHASILKVSSSERTCIVKVLGESL